MRYRLRTLLILLAVTPPLLWWGWERFTAWQEWRTAEQARQAEQLAQQRRLAQRKVVFRLTTAVSQIRQRSMPMADSRGFVDPRTGLRPVPGERDYQSPPWKRFQGVRVDSFDQEPPAPPK